MCIFSIGRSYWQKLILGNVHLPKTDFRITQIRPKPGLALQVEINHTSPSNPSAPQLFHGLGEPADREYLVDGFQQALKKSTDQYSTENFKESTPLETYALCKIQGAVRVIHRTDQSSHDGEVLEDVLHGVSSEGYGPCGC